MDDPLCEAPPLLGELSMPRGDSPFEFIPEGEAVPGLEVPSTWLSAGVLLPMALPRFIAESPDVPLPRGPSPRVSMPDEEEVPGLEVPSTVLSLDVLPPIALFPRFILESRDMPSRFIIPPGAVLGSIWLPAGAVAGGLPWGLFTLGVLVVPPVCASAANGTAKAAATAAAASVLTIIEILLLVDERMSLGELPLCAASGVPK